MSVPPGARDRVRVATLNLWGRFADWPRRREILAAQLPPLAIDVYLLQEVVCGDGHGDQLRELADLLGYRWTARVIAENRPHETEDEGVAVLSRVPLHSTAVWPLPPSHPPRHRLETSIDWNDGELRLITLHAAVSTQEGRDAQIAALASLTASPLILGSDLNAPPRLVQPLLGGRFGDTLDWDDRPTWPVDADEFVEAWKEKLGEAPSGDPEPRRMDYLLYRGLAVDGSATVALRDAGRSGSDHRLVWADVTGCEFEPERSRPA
jgi:endonuclease/exonuclease/phosphatase family metal-dependent hydrolase